MRKQLQIMILPLAAYGAIVGFSAQFLHQQQHLSCGSAPGALIATASACGYRHPVSGVLSPDRKHLVFAETERSRVVILDARTLAYEGQIGADVLKWPHDISFGPDGQLYVADWGRDRVAVFKPSPDGSYQYASELRGDFTAPDGVLARPDGTIYVSSQATGAIIAFRDGKEIARTDGLEQPRHLSAAPDGGILVVEAGHNRILSFPADLSRPGEPLALSRPLREPRALDVNAAGDLIVTEKTTSLIKFYDRDGRLERTIGAGKADFGPNALSSPAGIDVEGDRLWVTDSGNGRIVIMNLHNDTM